MFPATPIPQSDVRLKYNYHDFEGYVPLAYFHYFFRKIAPFSAARNATINGFLKQPAFLFKIPAHFAKGIGFMRNFREVLTNKTYNPKNFAKRNFLP
jgi:hypothetical protein